MWDERYSIDDYLFGTEPADVPGGARPPARARVAGAGRRRR